MEHELARRDGGAADATNSQQRALGPPPPLLGPDHALALGDMEGVLPRPS